MNPVKMMQMQKNFTALYNVHKHPSLPHITHITTSWSPSPFRPLYNMWTAPCASHRTRGHNFETF